VLRELVALERDYRRRQGESQDPEDYRARFPELGPTDLTTSAAYNPVASNPHWPCGSMANPVVAEHRDDPAVALLAKRQAVVVDGKESVEQFR
jgi:hypothetical protein